MFELSPESVLWSYWGKADRKTNPEWYRTMFEHSLDVVAVSEAWVRLVPSIEGGLIYGTGNVGISPLRRFFFYLHDFGKIHWKFQRLSPNLWFRLQGIDKNDIAYKPDCGYDHGEEGYSELLKYYGIPDRDESVDESFFEFKEWANRVCGHHHIINSRGKIWKGKIPRAVFLNPETQKAVEHNDDAARREFIRVGMTLFPEIQREKNPFAGFDNSTAFSTVGKNRNLQGFCSVCDWLASNEAFFRDSCDIRFPEEYLAERTKTALRKLADFGVVSPKISGKIHGMSTLFPVLVPRGIQTTRVDATKRGTLVIVESPTGSGKTEYALSIAAEMVAGGTADSVIFALPRQASANEMFRRIGAAAGKLFPEGASVSLAHGSASLYRPYLESKRSIDDEESEESETYATEWLIDSNKRAMLGNVCICTVDQVLLSAFPIRHSFVRSFALSKSVLVVDEVHSYDELSNALLDRILEKHCQTGGCAILLSATLPEKRKKKLVEMWEKSSGRKKTSSFPPMYPLVTCVGPDSTTFIEETNDDFGRRLVDVSVMRLPGAFPDNAVFNRIIDSARQGEVVAVICNTVSDCQSIWKTICSLVPEIPVDIFHSRYMYEDRERIERCVVDNYGANRPSGIGRILVATQVVEQSLDLDFDFMVTQNCPVDLLFQRLGRLYRTIGRTRVRQGLPKCLVLAHDKDSFGAHSFIYNKALLWRTRAMLEENGDVPLSFPEVYRKWIDMEYSTSFPDEPEDISESYERYESDGRALRSVAALFTDEEQMFTGLSENSESVLQFATRNGDFSIPVLCYNIETECVIGDGTLTISDIDNPVFREQVERKRISVPSTWEQNFVGGLVKNCSFGRMLAIPMKKTGEIYETSPDLSEKYVLQYGKFGLKKQRK